MLTVNSAENLRGKTIKIIVQGHTGILHVLLKGRLLLLNPNTKLYLYFANERRMFCILRPDNYHFHHMFFLRSLFCLVTFGKVNLNKHALIFKSLAVIFFILIMQNNLLKLPVVLVDFFAIVFPLHWGQLL